MGWDVFYPQIRLVPQISLSFSIDVHLGVGALQFVAEIRISEWGVDHEHDHEEDG